MTETYELAFFDNAKDNKPRLASLTAEQLAELFSRHDVRADKDGPAFSPTLYVAGKTRRNANVVALTLAVGDFDRGDVPPERLRDHLAGLGVRFWIHSTHSSKPDRPKFRVVVPLLTPVPEAQWGRVWAALVRELFLGAVDLGTRDASRIFFLPSAPPGSSPFVYRGDGVAFDWSALRLDPEPRRRPLTLPGDTSPIATGERHSKLVSIAGRLRNAGAGYDAILAELREVNEKRCAEKLTEREIGRIAASTCKYEPGPSMPVAPDRISAERPPLEEFDPETGEIFEAADESGQPTIGIAWVTSGKIYRTTLPEELRRIAREYDEAIGKDPKGTKEAAEARERSEKRLLRSLPFTETRDSLWPLGNDPTSESVGEWERRNGLTLEAGLENYYAERVVTNDLDGHLLLALFSMGASARSPHIDFAPRLMFEAPFGWGKSTAAEAVQLVVPRAVYGAALTPAAVHRMMNEWHPALLVDESAVADNPDLLRVLRAGFKRGTKIIRAAQNQDRGVVLIDPFGWVILTTQVDTREDLVSRCYVLHLTPGEPPKRVTIRDPEAKELRTILVRMRLEILVGQTYRDIAETAESARAKDGLEPRSRDKLTALWPFAVQYGAEDRLVAAASRLEEDSTEQLASSDKGLVVAAIAQVVSEAGGLAKVKAQDLAFPNVHRHVEELLIEQGEGTKFSVGQGETVTRLDPRRYGPRDFTGKIVRELGFKVGVTHGRARIDLKPFVALWPRVSSRYGVSSIIDDLAEREGRKTPTIPTPRGAPPSGIPSKDDPRPAPTPPLPYPYQTGGGVGIRAPDPDAPRAREPPPSSSKVDSGGAEPRDPARREAAIHRALELARSVGTCADSFLRGALAGEGFTESEQHAAIGGLFASGNVRRELDGTVVWREHEP